VSPSQPRRPDVLIGMVGENPISLLIAIHTLQPRRVVLFATPATRPKAERVLARANHPSGLVVAWGEVPAIDALARDAVTDARLLPTESVVLDITGATKSMTIGVWQALVDRGSPFGAACLMPDRKFVDARTGKEWPTAQLEFEDHVHLQGHRIRHCKWRGLLSEVPDDLRHRGEAARRLLALFGKWQPDGAGWIKSNSAKGSVALPTRPGSADAAWIDKNVWLEELALVVAIQACAGARGVRAGLGVEIDGDGQGDANDESDVVLVRGAHVVVIEAKASGRAGGAGPDLLKRVQKAGSTFGQCRVVFFRPSLTRNAIEALQPMARNADLIANDLEQLRWVIAAGLGL
jgi:hypothetical protein